MQKINFILLAALSVTSYGFAEGSICKKCDAIREDNAKNHKNYEYYDDYLRIKDCGCEKVEIEPEAPPAKPVVAPKPAVQTAPVAPVVAPENGPAPRSVSSLPPAPVKPPVAPQAPAAPAPAETAPPVAPAPAAAVPATAPEAK